MILSKEGRLLRIHIGENNRHEGIPLYEWIVREARKRGLAGATVFRALEGFGAHSRLHTTRVLRLSSNLPIVIEIIDTAKKIDEFMPVVDAVIEEGLRTIEKVDIHFYRSGEEPGKDSGTS